MSLQEKIEQDFMQAFKESRKAEAGTLRLIKSAMANKKIEKKIAKDGFLSDDDAVSLLKSEIKKRQDSIQAYADGGRNDLVDVEKAEIAVIERYLPAQLGDDQIRAIVKEAITESGASSPADFGKAMGLAMAKIKNQADGNQVSRIVREELNT